MYWNGTSPRLKEGGGIISTLRTSPLLMLRSNPFILSTTGWMMVSKANLTRNWPRNHTVKWQNVLSELLCERAGDSREHKIRYPWRVDPISSKSSRASPDSCVPRKTWVRSTGPTASMVYLSALSRRLRNLVLASRLSGSVRPEAELKSVNGSSEPRFRLRPVHLGTVTRSKMLFVRLLVDCSGLAMGSSGRRVRFAGVSALGGFRI